MKKIVWLIIFVATLSLSAMTACKSNNKNNQTALDTVWNESIQDEFFGVHFGATKKELLNKFAKYGIICNYNLSTNTTLRMASNQGEYFSFGDINWNCMNVNFNKNKFNNIQFYCYFKDKQEALHSYENLKSMLSQKYKFTEKPPSKDSTVYERAIAFGKNQNRMGIVCTHYESVNHEMWYGVFLDYQTLAPIDISSDF
jgi:putative glycine betaine/L-proline ABC transporter, glycine betaine/L-proline-binding protein